MEIISPILIQRMGQTHRWTNMNTICLSLHVKCAKQFYKNHYCVRQSMLVLEKTVSIKVSA